jgi:hypothetical protein
LAIGLGLFLILLVRGLDFGPLQTDVIIIRSWFSQVGVGGFSQRYFDVNQRHILAGPFYALVYSLFGEQDLPYNAIFQLSRVLEGVFMAGLVHQLTRRRALAVCTGLALMLTVIRVRELYQGINWFIEPTLVLLLASSYTYLRSLRAASRRWLWYLLSLALYVISILIYESGLPWIGVNLFLGWAARREEPPRRRVWLAVRDALPGGLAAGLIAFLVLAVFVPWQGLAPDASAGSPLRVLSQAGTAITFPVLVVTRLREAAYDGYAGLVILFAALAAILGTAAVIASRRADPDEHATEAATRTNRDYAVLLALALIMLLASVLVGTSNQIGQEYLDRITFGRAAGISLLVVTLIFLAAGLLRPRWREVAAVGLTGLLLLGPGLAVMWMYQDVAHRSRAEIDRIAAAVIEVRRVIYLPVELIIVTDPDWVLAKFTDASDVILHDVQQKLFAANEPATIDFLKTGMYAENYATLPGSCQTVNGQASGGLCLGEKELRSSRWAVGPTHPYDDVVVVHWDARAGKLDILRGISLADLAGYNISTAGPTELRTNPARLAIPIPQVSLHFCESRSYP